MIKASYWIEPSRDCEKPAAGGGNFSEAEIIEIRRSLLQIARVVMQHSILNGTWRSERSWADIQVLFL